MIEQLLISEEGKTLEFKESAESLGGIVRAAIAFANTAGGIIVVGIQDRTKQVTGLKDPLMDETRIVNAVAESVTPLLMLNIDIQSYRGKALLLIEVPYAPKPYCLKHEPESKGCIRPRRLHQSLGRC